MTSKKGEIIKAYEAAEEAIINAGARIQDIEVLMDYSGFEEGDEPQIMIASSEEIIMVWHDLEMFPSDFIYIMDKNGTIIPDDFFIEYEREYKID